MIVLGFSVGHDKGAAIIRDGKVVVAITQERLTRVKNDGAYQGGSLPLESLVYCLSEANVTIDDLDLIVYSTTEIHDDVYDQLNKVFRVPQKKLIHIPHHLAHAYSSYFSSGIEDVLDESAVIVADASGSILNHVNRTKEWYPEKYEEILKEGIDVCEGISIYHFSTKGHQEVYKKWIKYPPELNTGECTSLGTMYSDGSIQLIYEPKTGTWPAGKLMGLASYADQNIVDEAPLYATWTDESETDICIPNNRIYPKVTWESDFFSKACVAGIYQREQERISLMLAQLAKKLTNTNKVCTAGGSFLNCNSNEQIIKSGLFEKSFFIPPADDSGIPLGCAWYAYTQVGDVEKVDMIKPYLGRSYNDEDIESALSKHDNLVVDRYENIEDLISVVTEKLVNNRVIGWFQGGAELGPRALGNRSILASPKPKWMKDHINHDIKGREWYRPFAPAVMYDHQSEIFDLDVYSPHMLVTSMVKEGWREKIPAVTHVDGSARYQSVTEENNQMFYKLIESFYNQTDVPVLLNTSFNGPHEPMVESPTDAINCFLNRNLDFLVLENYFIGRVKL
jgi:carbamoyltransferase